MARGKRSESNGLDAANALKAAKDEPAAETGAVEEQGGDEDAPGAGHNGPEPLTEEQTIALTFSHKRAYAAALATKKAADAALKNTAKLAKSELGDTAVADIKDIIAIETEDGEKKLKAEVERKLKIARWMGLPNGANGELFPQVDRTPAVDRAAARGKRDGLAGERANPQCDPSVPQYNAYLEAYNAGQKIAFTIKPLVPPEPVAAAPTEEPDDFDTLPPADEPPAPAEVSVG